MKKFFEFILVGIIFYGVYAAFEKASYFLFPKMSGVWIMMSSLLAAILLLLLYSFIVKADTKRQAKDEITRLKYELRDRDELLLKKDDEIKQAQSFKEELISEAEQSELQE